MSTIGPVEVSHLWSLAVEEQFYLIWAWAVVALGSIRRILYFSLFGAALALALRLWFIHIQVPDQRFIYLELPTRADTLLLGAATAMLYRDSRLMARIRPVHIRFVGLAASLGFAAISLPYHTFFWAQSPIDTWGFSFTAIASTAVLLLALNPLSWTARILSSPVLRFYGRYSYGLYLIHFAPLSFYKKVLWPAISARIHIVWLAGAISFSLIVVPCTLIAVMSFHFIEQPFLRMKRRYEAPRQTEQELAAQAV